MGAWAQAPIRSPTLDARRHNKLAVTVGTTRREQGTKPAGTRVNPEGHSRHRKHLDLEVPLQTSQRERLALARRQMREVDQASKGGGAATDPQAGASHRLTLSVKTTS